MSPTSKTAPSNVIPLFKGVPIRAPRRKPTAWPFELVSETMFNALTEYEKGRVEGALNSKIRDLLVERALKGQQ